MYCHVAVAVAGLLSSCFLGVWLTSLSPPSFLLVFRLAFPSNYILPCYRPKKLILSTNDSNIYSWCTEELSHSSCINWHWLGESARMVECLPGNVACQWFDPHYHIGGAISFKHHNACVIHAHPMLKGARKSSQIPWNLSYRQLWTAIWMFGIDPGSMDE